MISKSTMMALPLDQTRRCCTLARSPMWVEVSQQEEVRCYAFALRPSRCRSLQKPLPETEFIVCTGEDAHLQIGSEAGDPPTKGTK